MSEIARIFWYQDFAVICAGENSWVSPRVAKEIVAKQSLVVFGHFKAGFFDDIGVVYFHVGVNIDTSYKNAARIFGIEWSLERQFPCLELLHRKELLSFPEPNDDRIIWFSCLGQIQVWLRMN